jgi:hypothetical protein
MGDLNERDSIFEKSTRHQTLSSKIMFAIAIMIGSWFFRDIEYVSSFHQFQRLLVTVRVSVGHCGSALG